MKKPILILMFLLCVALLWAQSNITAGRTTGKELLPSKYAVVLYASQVKQRSGNNNLLAAHWQNKGGGIFTWERNIATGGYYEIAINYATNKTGIVATLSCKGKKIIAALDTTSGYYPEKKSWSDINAERKKVHGKLFLAKGVNTITLELKTTQPGDELLLHTVELFPVANKTAIKKDQAAAEKMRANTSWFSAIPYGVMFHWTSRSTPQQGPLKPYKQAVNDFDVSAFVKMVKRTGAGYVIFTTNHAEPYFPAPLKEWEKVYPGHTTQRDLVQEISDSLGKYNIRLFLYMASHVYAKLGTANDDEFKRLNHVLVGEVGERYKKKVAGFWFDGWYQGYESHPAFDFEKFYKVAKTGNPHRLVCFNTWLYPVNTMWQDYWPGEVYVIGKTFANSIIESGAGKGLQSHYLIVMETEDWLHSTLNKKIPPPHLQADALIKFISGSNGPVTINMQIYQDGSVGDEALAVMEEVKKAILKN